MAELASDNFDRADNASLGANWTPNISGQQFLIVSNAAKPTATTHDTAESYTAVSFPADQYSEIVIGGVEAGGVDEGCGVVCRATAPSTTLTAYRLIGNGSGYGLLRFNAGASTSLQASSSPTFATNDVLRLEVRTIAEGAYWTAKKNGIPFASGLDTSALASGRAGIAYSSSDTSATIASWAGGDLPAVKLAGVPVNVLWAAGADPAGQSITVPSGTTAAVMFWSYFAGAGNGLLSATLAGAAPGATLELPNATGGMIAVGAAIWISPPSGAQTLDVAWDAAPSAGPLTSVAFLTGASPTSWRDVDADQDTSTNPVTVTLTTLADDIVLKYNTQGSGNTAGISSGWQGYNSQLNAIYGRLTWIWATGTSQVCDGENEDIPALVALSFGAEEAVAVAAPTLYVVRGPIRSA